MYGYGYGCGNPLAMVGAMGAPSYNPMLPPLGAIPLGNFVPPIPPVAPGGPAGCVQGSYYWPNCSPCPPSAEAVAASQAAYNAACMQKQARVQAAAQSVIASQQPQIGLGIRTLGATTVAAGGTATLTATPSVPLCITDFEVSRATAQFFLINGLTVGRVNYLADGQGLPADSFAPDADHPPLEMPMLWPGTQLTLIIENIDDAAQRFFGTFWGISGPASGPCLG